MSRPADSASVRSWGREQDAWRLRGSAAIAALLACRMTRGRPTVPMRSMPPTSPKPAPARSKAGYQTATNTDFSAVANPSCAVNIFRPVELSLQTVRSRSDGEWSTTLAPKAKTNIAPTGIGRFGVAFYAGGSFDAMTGENLTAFAVVPVTYRLSETMRINLNGGWLWDRTRRPALPDLWPRLRLETHRRPAVDHRDVRPGRRIGRRRAWSGRDFRPACVTGRTRFSRST